MEVSPSPIPGAEDWPEQFAATLQVQRQRVGEFLSAQQERLRRAETDLSRQLQEIAVELSDDRRQTLQAREELTQRSGQLQEQAEVLEQMKIELAARQSEWETLYHRVIEQQQSFADQLKLQQDEFARRRQDLLQQQSAAVAAETQLMLERNKLEAGLAELESQRTELYALRDSLQSQQTEIEKRREELSARTAETESRRRCIARELKTQHAAHLKELEHRRIELEQAAKADHSELQRQLESLQEECRILKNKASTETRQQLADAQPNRGEDDEDDDIYRRRYEMAVDDLRELKARNEELQEQLTRSRQNGGGNAAQISSGIINWEAEKQRILAALEADFDEENEEDREEKLKIEDVISKTDRVVAEKNREIGELRELLESQTNNIGSVAVGAAALGHILDTDAVIQEERKNLAFLQEECRDKLRHAEVQISLERAKIAREQAQLDEKLRALKQQGVDITIVAEQKEPAKPIRGRWLARLGLTDSDDDQGT